MLTDITPEKIQWIVQGMITLILSIAVHEFGHAWVADRLGDRLPRQQGRVTLNPIAHADPIGTLLLPLGFMLMSGGLGFGWGKPVYHNTHDRKKRLFISFAGPAMNVMLAVVITSIHVGLLVAHVDIPVKLGQALGYAVGLNFVLFFFNLLPFSPLDGGSVARGLIPRDWVDPWDKVSVYAPFVVMAFIMVAALGEVFRIPAAFMTRLLYNGLGELVGLGKLVGG